MTLEKQSPCKVNLLLNILGKRTDGFHELETVMQPVKLFDRLRFDRSPNGVELTCNHFELPVDRENLVFRAAAAFLEEAGIREGVRIHLEKQIPLAAGLGGGSGNAATTLLGLNELFDTPLSISALNELAATLGSDVPFFLQTGPALATGRGETIRPLKPFPALANTSVLLVHPGFGISTAWAYQQLARYPEALKGAPGRAEKLVGRLQAPGLEALQDWLFNSLEAPALHKYPLLALLQDFLRQNGAAAALMSGSGSTTFAVFESQDAADRAAQASKERFGRSCWTAVVPV